MSIVLIIVSMLLIAIVLLQSGKAESASMTGANDNLFANRKERGGELFISRLTLILGMALFVICIAMNILK